VRQVKWLLLRAPEALGAGEAAFLDHLRTLSPEIDDTTYRLAHEFKRLVHARDQAALDPWLVQAAHSHIKEIEGFAGGIRKDRAAIDAALTIEWSNGQLEGGVNKLKTLKRQMYGRASFDLLRQRTLYYQRRRRIGSWALLMMPIPCRCAAITTRSQRVGWWLTSYRQGT